MRTFAAQLQTTYAPTKTFDGLVRLALVRNVKHDEEESLKPHEDVIAGWQRDAPNLTAWRGPGNRMTILKPPYVNTLAGWVRESLDERK